MLATLALAAMPQRDRPARSMRADLQNGNGAEQCRPSEGSVTEGSYAGLAAHLGDFINELVGSGLGMCACAKCGTSSLGNYMYEVATGKAWNYTGPPYVQSYNSERWPSGTWETHTDVQSVAKSIAFVREPVGRLISAWVDKIRDNNKKGSRFYGCNLVYAEGRNRTLADPTYIDLDTFAEMIKNAHDAGNDELLNEHMRPQNKYCFRQNDVAAWSLVGEIGNETMTNMLGQLLGSGVEFPHQHATSSSEVEVSAQARADLEAATAEEANYIAPYLSDASKDRLDAAQSSTGARLEERAGAPLAVSGADGAKPSPWRLADDAHPEGKWFYTMPAEFDGM